MIELGQGSGPLRGVKVVEIGALGPGPHAATILADLGADVIRIDRPTPGYEPVSRATDLLSRGRPSVVLDLKQPDAVAAVLELVEGADAFIEGMRPGVAERLGIGPEACLGRNPRLVYGRMTGWGQTGPWAKLPGHDIDYIALSGTLYSLGQDPQTPHFPGAIVGDFGGGSTYLVIGILAALLESRVSGLGQVIDAAVVDGAAHENLLFASLVASGQENEERAQGTWGGQDPTYAVYRTADGRHMAVGPVEVQFQRELVAVLGLDPSLIERPADFKATLTEVFLGRTQAEWAEVFDGTETCVVPVLPYTEAARHHHNVARGTFVERDGLVQPGPAPRFSRTVAELGAPPSVPGQHTRDALLAWGVDPEPLLATGAARQAPTLTDSGV